MDNALKRLGFVLLAGLLASGCMKTQKVFHSQEIAFYQEHLRDQEAEMEQLRQAELFEEGIANNIQRDYEKLQGKVKKYLALNCLCAHKDVLR